MINPERIFEFQTGISKKGPVVYWMSRDQRVRDNWALCHASHQASERKEELRVVFTLCPTYPGATWRSFDFMLSGLEKVEELLHTQGIPFTLLLGDPDKTLPGFLKETNASLLITDFDPLRIKKEWRKNICNEISIPFLEVDAHNIVPCRQASSKQEFGAYTLRPKIHKLLSKFLDEYPELPHRKPFIQKKTDWLSLRKNLSMDRSVFPVSWINAGEEEAEKGLEDFINYRLKGYAKDRNDPNLKACSNFSPWLHYGHMSAQRIALEILKRVPKSDDTDAFLEELIIRRELADNFCHYNAGYDSFDAFPEWAKKQHAIHRNDEREYVYTIQDFENASTHDPLWNAAQKEMVKTGKMHGYMRMYWAKKILEWTPSPEEALRIALYLNDKYELDGRDPNGYAGCAWSIGGLHDRPWAERPVFGQIRYMNFNGAKRKFDVEKYIESFS